MYDTYVLHEVTAIANDAMQAQYCIAMPSTVVP